MGLADVLHRGGAGLEALQSLDLMKNPYGELHLMSEPFIRRAGPSLQQLSCCVRGTSTLQRFPRLHTLKLRGGSGFRMLYPAVLSGMPSLRELHLIGYAPTDNFLLNQIPPDIWCNLKVCACTTPSRQAQSWQKMDRAFA